MAKPFDKKGYDRDTILTWEEAGVLTVWHRQEMVSVADAERCPASELEVELRTGQRYAVFGTGSTWVLKPK
jgi:hypothetical protein